MDSMGVAASFGRKRSHLPRHLDVEDDYIRPPGHAVLCQVRFDLITVLKREGHCNVVLLAGVITSLQNGRSH